MSDAPDTQAGSAEWVMDRVAHIQLDGDNQAAAPSLESVPAELRLRVLSTMPDLESLGSLIQASPMYLAQFRLDRESLLSGYLEADLCGEVLIDAVAAFSSTSSKIGPRTDPNSNVTDFLDLYGWWRYTRSDMAMLKSMSLADIRRITSNHASTVRPLAAQISRWFLKSFKPSVIDVRPEGTTISEIKSVPTNVWYDGMSCTERRRVLRGLYRFQIFCNLFGGEQYQSFTSEEIQRIFFCQFDGWEVEEMCCFRKWIEYKWAGLVTAAKWDRAPSKPESEDEAEGSGSLRLDGASNEYFKGTVMRGGLRFALDMAESDDHSKRVELVSKYFTRAQVPCFFDNCVFCVVQYQRRQAAVNCLCERDLAERRRDPMPFRGDEMFSAPVDETDSDDKGTTQALSTYRPPFAWILMWRGKYSNLYGEYIPDLLRGWGYVMWDERRWNAIDYATHMLLMTWQSSRRYQQAKADFDYFGDLP